MTVPSRRHDWASAMHAVAVAHEGRTFEWGVNDCCLYAARTIDAMVGSVISIELASRYSDEASAKTLIEANGGLTALVSSYLGLAQEPDMARATRGDIVLIDGGLDEAIAVCFGPYLMGMGHSGLRRISRGAILRVWKI